MKTILLFCMLCICFTAKAQIHVSEGFDIAVRSLQGGTFVMGSDIETDESTHTVKVNDFRSCLS